MENSLSNTLQTKVLNSAMVDETDSTPYTMENILMNHWLLFSSANLYTAFLLVDNPVTGEPIVPMNAKDGFAFMWFCYSMSIGVDLTQRPLPAVLAQRVVRMPQPSTTDLLSIVDWSLITQDMAQQALGYMPTIEPMISITSFVATATAIWQAANSQRSFCALQEDFKVRGMLYGMTERIYSDNIIQLGDGGGETYAQWFTARNISIGDFTAADYGLMYQTLVQAATGINLTNVDSIAAVQAAMIGIMRTLSSYSVQYLYEINDGEILDVDWPMIRSSEPTVLASVTAYSEENLSVSNVNVQGEQTSPYFDIGAPFTEVLGAGATIKHRDNITINTWLGTNSLVVNEFIQSASVGVSSATPLPTNDRGIIPVIGLDLWLALTPAQQEESLVSVYMPDWNSVENPPIPEMAAIWPTNVLSGLTYTPPSN
jgi:hypothetical protein